MIMMMMTCFCETVGQLKSFKVFFESVRFLEILTIANFRHVQTLFETVQNLNSESTE